MYWIRIVSASNGEVRVVSRLKEPTRVDYELFITQSSCKSIHEQGEFIRSCRVCAFAIIGQWGVTKKQTEVEYVQWGGWGIVVVG